MNIKLTNFLPTFFTNLENETQNIRLIRMHLLCPSVRRGNTVHNRNLKNESSRGGDARSSPGTPQRRQKKNYLHQNSKSLVILDDSKYFIRRYYSSNFPYPIFWSVSHQNSFTAHRLVRPHWTLLLSRHKYRMVLYSRIVSPQNDD